MSDYYSPTTEEQAYQDGRTDGRTYARTHTAEERAAQLELARRRRANAGSWVWWRYHDGYCEILENWVDGQGA